MELKTEKTTINQNQEVIFDFLEDSKNFEELMPSSIEKFEVVEGGQFNFQLSGMPEIRLKPQSKSKSDQIILTSAAEKFDFDLKISLEGINEHQTQVQLLFSGNFNSMMAMMIKSPINNFIDKLLENLAKKYQG